MSRNESLAICNTLCIDQLCASIETLTITIRGIYSVHAGTTYWFVLTILGLIGLIK
jgi:hypothetical protein